MSDQSGVPGGDAGQGPNWEEQYNQLRPEFTRTTQELAQYRDSLSEYESLFEGLRSADPQVQAETLAQLGYEMDTGQPQGGAPDDDDFVDPLEKTVEQLQSELGAIRSQQELEAQAAEAAELEQLEHSYIDDALDLIEESTKSKFSDHEANVLGNLAIAMRGDDGVPDVQGAYNSLFGDGGVVPTRQQNYVTHKQGASVAPLGTTIPADKRPTNRRERIQYIDERVRATMDQQ